MFDLKLSLEKYIPFDSQEQADKKAILTFLKETEKNSFSRENKAGHVTAGAFVASKDGQILLNHHKKTDMWLQFGGHSDGNPDSFEVAKREVFEEAGISDFLVAEPNIFDVSVQEISANEKKQEPSHLHYDINFLFISKNKDFKVSNESTEIKWVSIKEAKKLISPDDIPSVRMLKKFETLLENKKI